MPEKYHNGAFCFFRSSSTLEPMFPDQITALADQYSLPQTLTPAYAGDRAVAARSISATQGSAARQGYILRPLVKKQRVLIYAIVREEKDDEGRTIRHTHEKNITWTLEMEQGEHIIGTHEVALEAEATYQDWRGKIAATDWTYSISTYLLGTCHAQMMRDDGRVWWCPPQTLPALYQLTAFLGAVGITMVILEVEAEHQTVIQQATTESIAGQLTALQEEAEAFDGTQKPSTYKGRLEEYQVLRRRATLYKEALGIGVEQAEGILASLEEKVQGLLEIRSKTIIHRKERLESKPMAVMDEQDIDNDPVANVSGF